MLTTAPGGPPGASEPRSGAGSTSSRVTAPMPSIWMLSPRRRSNLVGSPPSAGAQPKVATHSCRSECRPSHRRIPASTCTGGIDDRIGRASPFSTPAGSGALRVNGRVHHNHPPTTTATTATPASTTNSTRTPLRPRQRPPPAPAEATTPPSPSTRRNLTEQAPPQQSGTRNTHHNAAPQPPEEPPPNTTTSPHPHHHRRRQPPDHDRPGQQSRPEAVDNWIARYKKGHATGQDRRKSSESVEIAELRAENRKFRQENEFLKRQPPGSRVSGSGSAIISRLRRLLTPPISGALFSAPGFQTAST